jgi:hypothetical protein
MVRIPWRRALTMGSLLAIAGVSVLWCLAPPTPVSTLVGNSSDVVPPSPGLADLQPSALTNMLPLLAGSTAIACGVVPISVARDHAFTCAADAASAGKAFWVAFQLQDVDRFAWQGTVGDGRGKQWVVNYDSDANGGNANLSVSCCTSLNFTSFGSAVECEHAANAP